MVIHIVNGLRAEKLPFLQFIYKSEQFSRSILAGQNQIRRSSGRRPVENSANRLAWNRNFAEEVCGILTSAVPVICKNPIDSPMKKDFSAF
jgi:hypothetical protein